MPDFFDFMTEGGDDLLHSHQCPQCKTWFDEDEVQWNDKERRILQCPSCLRKIELEG
jgi:hypothetical protein